jgi:hypothetical protein
VILFCTCYFIKLTVFFFKSSLLWFFLDDTHIHYIDIERNVI